CSLQHMRPDAQILAKQQVLLENLKHIGKVQPQEVFEPITAEPWGYRRRARLGVRHVPKKGGVLVGFREKQSSFIADHVECHVLAERSALLLPELRTLIGSLSCPGRIPQIEVADSDQDLVLVFRHLDPLSAKDLEKLKDFAEVHSVVIRLQPGGADTVHDLEHAAGAVLSYEQPDHHVHFEFRPTDFVQINDPINRLMVSRAIELLSLQPGDRVLDLFCGLGNFTLPVARYASFVTGLEGDTGLVQRARRNARINQIDNVVFATADLYGDEANIRSYLNNHNKLLLDPPRSGAIEVIRQIGKSRPECIVYVSCNPATLARDADCLVNKHGYRLQGAGALDMFPHTAHVESIALFNLSR
ncbi:MAG: 23S rRNA (uracil(1939)-C(5))-methyltransferase RlmD, partial [Gammaproteobacteria bacterium]